MNQSHLTNFLLRVTVGPRATIKIYFLGSVYSGIRKTNAVYYKEEALRMLSKWVTVDRIVGVVSDNTGNVKNAREMIMKENFGLIASQDQAQAHVADRLMGDFGDLEWISETLDKVSFVSVNVRRSRKLREMLSERIAAWSLQNQEKIVAASQTAP